MNGMPMRSAKKRSVSLPQSMNMSRIAGTASPCDKLSR
jgi:hypothetical protein